MGVKTGFVELVDWFVVVGGSWGLGGGLGAVDGGVTGVTGYDTGLVEFADVFAGFATFGTNI